MVKVKVEPNVLNWARERAGLTISDLSKRFPSYRSWEAGDSSPTFLQLEQLSRALHIPLGMLFLSEPLEERPPLPDFRRIDGKEIRSLSTELLDTIHDCQRRISWYKDNKEAGFQTQTSVVASLELGESPEVAAMEIRRVLKLDEDSHRFSNSWSDHLRRLIRQVQASGILVMASSIVGNNTHRRLNVDEFRGFAIADEIAPLIFINSADSKAAQIFTLAHEIAHVWVGKSGISESRPDMFEYSHRIEQWCNRVAAELLVPTRALEAELREDDVFTEADRLARKYRVSTLVVLRRLFDIGRLGVDEFRQAYSLELERVRGIEKPKKPGGDFFRNLSVRVDRNFLEAVISSTAEGRTLVGEAMNLLSISSTSTLKKEAQELGYQL